MLNNKFWVHNQISEQDVEKLSKQLGVSKLVSKVLFNRDMRDTDYAEKFLNPSFSDMHDPFMLMDMQKAVERICDAINQKEKIVIYGDYDVDGVTSTSILYNFLNTLGVNIDYYIPDRLDEGYGLCKDALDKVFSMCPGLIITVDCGITALDEVNYIKEKGIDVIITDHHECGNDLPGAYALINPHRPDCNYPFKELAGVGVVYKLINAICMEKSLGDLDREYIDLVALGTVADVVPLLDENRIIVKYGMNKIQNTTNTGLKVLLESNGLKDKTINTGILGFVLAPRINAAGRLGDAARGVELFTTSDENKAMQIVAQLNEENNHRQNIQNDIYNQVVDIVEREQNLKDDNVIIAASKDWHPGVIGIVASKITERYYRPCILICDEDGTGKGSGRSIEGFNLFEALNACEEVLIKYGGHELAAGLTLNMDKISEFREMINCYAKKVLTKDDLVPRIKLDAYIDKADISVESVKELDMLEPFGPGNPRPVFACGGMEISQIRTVGDNRHLKMVVKEGNFYADVIGFNMGEYSKIYSSKDFTDLAFSLEINTWNSVQKVQLNLKDMRPNESNISKNQYFYKLDKCIELEKLNDYNSYDEILDNVFIGEQKRQLVQIQELVPEREEMAAVYRFLKANNTNDNKSFVIDNLFAFAGRVENIYKVCMNYFKLKRIIEIFEELKILKKKSVGECGMEIKILNGTKTSLDKSQLYNSLQSLKQYVNKSYN